MLLHLLITALPIFVVSYPSVTLFVSEDYSYAIKISKSTIVVEKIKVVKRENHGLEQSISLLLQ